jgi:hypothetical protein
VATRHHSCGAGSTGPCTIPTAGWRFSGPGQSQGPKAPGHWPGIYVKQPSDAVALDCRVPRYFFNTKDDDHILLDDEGVDLADLVTARAEAARTLAEIARDVLPGETSREITVEVRDAAQQPLFRAALLFGVEDLG